jgi:nucleotide-binding universal stress UspA family protein
MNAADHAISISKIYNAELYAMHVIPTDVDLLGPHETSELMTKMRDVIKY